MECKNCKKDFHYCSSCGYFYHAMLGFCEHDCMEYYYTVHPTEPPLEQLAGIVYHMEDGTPNFFKERIEQHKIEIGKIIVDKLLSGEDISYE